MTAIPATVPLPAARPAGAQRFIATCVAVALGAALIAGWTPIGFSIVTVFLFAGPHNWIEFRYFLTKMPAHWGPLRGYFIVAIAGVMLLTVLFAAIAPVGEARRWESHHWMYASATWNSLLVAWVTLLVWMRSNQSPRRDWGWAIPIGCLLIAIIWLIPAAWEVALVYLHPLIALLFLDRVLVRRRPLWRRAYHTVLLLVPVILLALWWRLANAPPLVGQDMLAMRITRHAGADYLTRVSPHLLVSTHTFLEMLHYGVWVFAIPLLTMNAAPWRLQSLRSVPLFRRSRRWSVAISVLLLISLMVVLVLWAGFIGNYALTRDVYFTVAIAHVLAEFPFLLRAA